VRNAKSDEENYFCTFDLFNIRYSYRGEKKKGEKEERDEETRGLE